MTTEQITTAAHEAYQNLPRKHIAREAWGQIVYDEAFKDGAKWAMTLAPEPNQTYRIETDAHGVYARVYIENRRTSSFVDISNGKYIDTLPPEIQEEAREAVKHWGNELF